MCGVCYWDKKAGIIKHLDDDEIDLAIEKLDFYIKGEDGIMKKCDQCCSKCECGAEKLNSTHYHWCPRFKDYGK